MYHFAVRRVPGPGWNPDRGLREQAGWAEHAAFMDHLAESGFVALGGPLRDGDEILLMVRADSEVAVRERLAGDPWHVAGILEIASVDVWRIVLGGVPGEGTTQ